MDATMDNPQETAKSGILTDYTRRFSDNLDLLTDISWVGGILDGEGSFILSRVTRKDSGGLHLLPQISIGNTNYWLIDEVARILTALGIPHHVHGPFQPRCKRYEKRNKPAKMLQIQGIKRVARALTVLLPYVRAKREAAEALLQYCEYRLQADHKQPYGDVEFEILRRIKDLNRRGREEELVGPAVKAAG
jgi:hypothetical protein